MSVVWVRWFPSDWRGSLRVGEMSLAERGLYRELLDLQASHGGPFGFDPARLARQMRCERTELETLWATVRAMFEQDGDGRWFNAKMQAEIDRSAEKHEQASRAGKASAEARARQRALEQTQPTDVGTGVPTERATERSTTPTPTPTPTQNQTQNQNKRGARSRAAGSRPPNTKAAAIADRPIGITEDAWSAWVDHQWARRKPTPTALAQHRKKLTALSEARDGSAAVAFMEQCIEANAQGIPRWAYDQAMSGQAAGRNGRPLPMSASQRLKAQLDAEGIRCEA